VLIKLISCLKLCIFTHFVKKAKERDYNYGKNPANFLNIVQKSTTSFIIKLLVRNTVKVINENVVDQHG